MPKWRKLHTDKIDKIFQRTCGYVYVLQAPDGRFKIGESVHVDRRRRELEAEFGCPLKVKRVIASLERKDNETHLHLLFDRRRQEREWFSLDNDDLALLEQRAQALEKLYDEMESGYAE